MQQLAQNPDALDIRLAHQQVLTAGARAANIDGGIGALLGNLAIQMDLHVTGSLELLIDDFIHLGASVDQRGGKNGQAAALFHVTGRTKETLGLLKGVGVHTTGQYLAGGRNHRVVGTGQTGDGIQQNHHIFLVLDQTLGLFDDHLGHLHMTGRGLIEGGGDHFTTHGALHLGYFFRTLVNQQHHHMALWIVTGDGLGDALHQQRLTGFGRRHDQAALALADGRYQIQNP